MVDTATEQKIINSLEINPVATLEGHLNGVDCLKFNPVKKNQLVSGSFDRTIRTWDINSKACLKEIKGHEGGIWSLDFNKDGKNFVTASADKTLKIWDASSYKEVATLKGHTYHIYSVSYNHDSSRIASSGEDGTVKIWDLKKNTVFKNIDKCGHIALSAQFSQDGKNLFVTNADGELIAYETTNFTEVARTEKRDGLRAFSIALDFNSQKQHSKTVFVGYEDNRVRRWVFNNNKFSLESEFITHLDQCKNVALNSNLGYLSTCGRDGSAKVWDIDNNGLLFNLIGGTDATTMSAFAGDEAHHLAVSSYDQRIRLYKLPNFNI